MLKFIVSFIVLKNFFFLCVKKVVEWGGTPNATGRGANGLRAARDKVGLHWRGLRVSWANMLAAEAQRRHRYHDPPLGHDRRTNYDFLSLASLPYTK